MELVPWRPLGELSSFRREMDRLLNRFFSERPFAGQHTELRLPSVDISESKDSFIVKTELPGLHHSSWSYGNFFKETGGIL